MKTLLILSTVATTLMTGCPVLNDYDSVWIFEVENQTDLGVIYITEESEIVIPPRETIEIYRIVGRTADNKNDFSDRYHHPDQPMLDATVFRIKVGDEFLPETIWIRRLWYFESEPLRAKYKLIITAELIELLKQSPNQN